MRFTIFCSDSYKYEYDWAKAIDEFVRHKNVKVIDIKYDTITAPNRYFKNDPYYIRTAYILYEIITDTTFEKKQEKEK